MPSSETYDSDEIYRAMLRAAEIRLLSATSSIKIASMPAEAAKIATPETGAAPAQTPQARLAAAHAKFVQAPAGSPEEAQAWQEVCRAVVGK
jgi:Tfp pilus assembly protein PilX